MRRDIQPLAVTVVGSGLKYCPSLYLGLWEVLKQMNVIPRNNITYFLSYLTPYHNPKILVTALYYTDLLSLDLFISFLSVVSAICA